MKRRAKKEPSMIADAVYQPRLLELFADIEREFRALYEENQELKARLKAYEEGAPGEPFDPPEIAKKQSGTISERFLGRVGNKSFKGLYRSQWEVSRDFNGHRDGVFDVTINPMKFHCFGTASADRSARIWDLESPMCRYNYLGHKGAVNSIRFHATEPLVCTSSGDKTCHIWKIPAIVWNNFDKQIQKEDESKKVDETGIVKEKLSQTEPTNLSGKNALYKLSGHTDAVIAACWIPTQKSKVLTGSWDQNLILWDTSEDKVTQVQKFSGHEQRVTNIAAHPREELALSTSRDFTFRIWDFRKPSSAMTVCQAHSGTVNSAMFSTVGNYVVSSSDDRTIKVWDIKYLKAPVHVIRPGSGCNRISISPFASMIAAPLDNAEIRLYDLNGGLIAKIPRSLNNQLGHQKKVCDTAWCHDENTLLACGFTESVLSWVPVAS